MDVRQLLLLALALAVPLVFFALGKPRLVLGWVGLTLSIHIFDTTIFTNLPAGRVVGLIYLPYAIASAPCWLRLEPAKAWMLNFCYLVALGLLFGFIWPWPDTTGLRPVIMTAPGRAVVFLTRLVSDLSLIVFMARELQKPGRLRLLGQSVALGASLTAIAAIFNFITKIDPYFTITGLRDLAGNQRARGLSFEPRGLGMACTYGLLMLIILPGRISTRRFGLIGINLLGLLVSYSTSSLALFLAGLITAWTFLSNRIRFTILGVVALLALLVALAPFVVPQQFAVATQSVRERIDPTSKLRGAVAENIVEMIAYRLDSFDASAVLFLADQPEYLFIGTGPGMMLLPASEYVPPGVYRLMYPPEKGLDGLPTHGMLLEVSNSGLIGLSLWLFQIISCFAALRLVTHTETDPEQAKYWRFGKALFIIGVVFYIVQVSMTSPVWSVILGIGWAAADQAAKHRRLRRKAAVPHTSPAPLTLQPS